GLGARSLEALPRGASDASDAEYWLGRSSTLLAAGFQVVHDFAPYPVLRLQLGTRSTARQRRPAMGSPNPGELKSPADKPRKIASRVSRSCAMRSTLRL